MGIIYGALKLPSRTEKYELIDSDRIETADVCIVGSGAAGAVLAKELVESGRSVVLLERGGYYEGKDMNQRDVDMMPLLWKNAGFNFDENLRIAIAQGVCLGGSTIINDAVCFDPPEKVRQEWKNMGVNFTDQEWDEHTKRVNKILNVSEVADDELNRNNQMLMMGARKLGFQEHRRNKRNCVNCMQCGYCHLGCHYQTKQDVLVTYLHQALRKPDLAMRVYCNCYVDRIIHNDGMVEGIEGTFRDRGGRDTYRIRVNAKVFIISAGAIASSKLLLRNGISQTTAGRGLCLHPAPFVLGDFDIEIKGNQGIPMAYTVHDFGVTRTSDETARRYNFVEGEFLIESIFLPLLQFSMALPGDVIQHRQLLERFNHYAMAGILVRDGNNGRVSLTPTGRANVTYKFAQKDLKTIAKGVEVLSKMWFKLNAKRVIVSHRKKTILYREEEIPEVCDLIVRDPDNLLLGSAHPQSGNTIGNKPEDSVVDSDCRVHGFKNLFVCDASVFPTALGANPQVTVMAVASIVAKRIADNWKNRYALISQSKKRGQTCSISQPWYCLRDRLSGIFDNVQTKFDENMLVNSKNDKPDDTNWKFDPKTMTITNDTHWKGIFTRDPDLPTQMTNFFGGFWKRFTKNASGVEGITHPFELEVYAKNKAAVKNYSQYRKAIILRYTGRPFRGFYDVLKFVDKNTILGKAFFGTPPKGREMLTFSMSRKYPFEFMTEEDHDMLYGKMKKPSLASMVGVWDGQLVSDSSWTPPIFRFRFYFDSNRVLKNQYLFGNILAGTATLTDKLDHVRMDDETEGAFHDEIRKVNNDILIGRYYSPSNEILNYIPRDVSFLHADKSSPRFYLPYVLKRVGIDSAFREYSD